MSDIEPFSTQALADIAAADTPEALEALRVGRLGGRDVGEGLRR